MLKITEFHEQLKNNLKLRIKKILRISELGEVIGYSYEKVFTYIGSLKKTSQIDFVIR